jgi:predicted dehydrogenase
MSKVRIGFVGVGGMGQAAHLRNYVINPDCEVVAIAELRPELGRKVGRRYGIEKVYTDHKQMLASEKLDALVNIQGFMFHAALLPDLFAANLPVITEKPLAGTIESGQKIIAARKATKAKHYLAYHKRSDPATMWVKQKMEQLAASKELGELRYVRILMPAGDWVAEGFSQNIHSDEPIPPVGTQADPRPAGWSEGYFNKYIGLVNYYIHQINLMRHLLGEDYSVKFGDRRGVTMTVESASGVTGLIEMSPYQTTIDWQESALVCYEKGWIRLELPAPLAMNRPGKVTMYSDPGNGVEPVQIAPELPWIHAMRQQANNFVKAVKGEKTPLCGAEDALKDLEVTKAYLDLYLSAGGKL